MHPSTPPTPFWYRFWHEPVRAERLAAVRLLLGLMIFAEQMLQYAPDFADLFGPQGVAYAGLNDAYLLRRWRLTSLFFYTDDLTILWSVFGVWVAVALAFTVGFCTRLMNVALWVLTMCFLFRNPNVINGGDDLMMCGLFLLMFMPSGKALSVDRWLALRRRCRRGLPTDDLIRPVIEPWGVRLLQIQVCMIYMTTGIAKLRGGIEGTWLQGTSVHYVLLDFTMARTSFARLPQWPWAYAIATWMSLSWETLFPLLVVSRRTRPWALWFGVLFHIGIYLAIEVGWFSFYTLALYGVWIPAEFWDGLAARFRRGRKSEAAPSDSQSHQLAEASANL